MTAAPETTLASPSTQQPRHSEGFMASSCRGVAVSCASCNFMYLRESSTESRIKSRTAPPALRATSLQPKDAAAPRLAR